MKNKRIFALLIPLLVASLSGCSDYSQFIGAGTKASPYLISSKLDLIKLSSLLRNYSIKFSKSHYKLTANIDMSGGSFYPIGNESTPFYGNFDGGGHIITNLDFTNVNQAYGLFGVVGETAHIHNLNLKYDYTYTSNAGLYFGGVAAYVYKGAKISDCSFSGSIGGNASKIVHDHEMDSDFYTYTLAIKYIRYCIGPAVGGIAGRSFGEITNCKVNGSLIGSITGGIVGENRGIISNCEINNSTITGYHSVGSLAGYLNNTSHLQTTIKDSKAYNVSLTSSDFGGGLVGATFGDVTVSNCLAYGTHNHMSDTNTINASYFGDLFGAVLYEQTGVGKETSQKQDSVNVNHLDINHNLVSFNTSVTGINRHVYNSFPYAEYGSTLTINNNISIIKINKDDVNYTFHPYVRSGYTFYLADDSEVSVSGAISASSLTKAIVATTLEKDESMIQEINIDGLIGYKY